MRPGGTIAPPAACFGSLRAVSGGQPTRAIDPPDLHPLLSSPEQFCWFGGGVRLGSGPERGSEALNIDPARPHDQFKRYPFKRVTFSIGRGSLRGENMVSEPISGPNFRPKFQQCRRKTHWAAPRFPEGLPEAFWKAPGQEHPMRIVDSKS